MSKPPTNCKDAILRRVREALASPTDDHVKTHTLTSPEPVSNEAAQQWLPAGGSNHAARLERFAAFSEKLRTEFKVVANHDAAKAMVQEIAATDAWPLIGRSSEPIVMHCLEGLDVPTVVTDSGTDYDPMRLEQCLVGITGCEALIAQTGSILVTCTGSGGRALSVLPPHHIVIATADQLVENMSAGYALLREKYGEKLPTQITFITGPSRTGDIERILVLGAHGPRRLTVILIDNTSA